MFVKAMNKGKVGLENLPNKWNTIKSISQFLMYLKA